MQLSDIESSAEPYSSNLGTILREEHSGVRFNDRSFSLNETEEDGQIRLQLRTEASGKNAENESELIGSPADQRSRNTFKFVSR